MNGPFPALAIVGLSCRFPKGLDNISLLLAALRSRFIAIDTVPRDRWTVERYYASHEQAKGKSYIRRGGFLTHDVSQFDASFFGISPRDAENMDPQQRLLLEVVWEAFENAGLILPDHAGRKVGVYVGGFMLDHMITQMSASNRSMINQYTAAGMMMTMLSNRISHTFDFRGPSLSIDTACSSSLVAFHYACQDLWRGACEMAVVGGANVMLRPEYPMGMCKGHFLSRDGECKSFDARGDGYGRGEGAGIVLVKPLDAALAAGDPVLATVLATGTNQDGRTPGISMPCLDAQRTLIQEVCAKYEIDPRRIRYVECHGTGTAVGDPTETRAVGETYGAARREIGPVVVGSIKSNIGHLEAAAGVAGVIKATLTALYRTTHPLANLQSTNPAIPLDELNLRLSDEAIVLGAADEPFCLAVNSFGYGGSNAHVILETPPIVSEKALVPSKPVSVSSLERRDAFPHFMPISGRSKKAVTDMAAKYLEVLQEESKLEDVLYTISHKRAHLSHRAVVKGADRASLIQGLQSLVDGMDDERVVVDVEPFVGHRRPVFVFTGMGPQWWAMGQELYRDDPIYRAAVLEADREFKQISGFSILAEMNREEAESRITSTVLAQPANFVLQIGLLAMLRAAGIEPGAVVGHSVGELASAYAAGALSLRDAMTVCYHRSRLQATCAGTGCMLAVGLSAEKVSAMLADDYPQVSIAAVNGPNNLTLAGDIDQLNEISQRLTQDNIFHRRLEVEVPYHSPMMDPILDELMSILSDVRPQVPHLPLYSTVTGQRVEGIAYDAAYWAKNVRQPVLFAPSILNLLAEGFNTFIEVGPHPVLATSLKECIKQAGTDCRTLFTLRRQMPERSYVHRAIMGIYAAGCEIDWSRHHHSGKMISLPHYAWQREKFWLENERAMQDRIAPVVHPILGIQEAPGAPVWRNDFDHEPVTYLRDHVVSGTAILPAAGYIEALLELAAIQWPDASGYSIRGLEILAPMILNVQRGLDCVTAYDPLTHSAVVRSLENGRLGSGQIHVTAQVGRVRHWQAEPTDLDRLRKACTIEIDPDTFYAQLRKLGLEYGPAFQAVQALQVDPSRRQAVARIQIDSSLTRNLSQYILHPSLLDACFQSLIGMFDLSETTYLPTGIGEMNVYMSSSPETVWCHCETVMQTERHLECHLTLLDDQGYIVATIRSMRLTAAAKRGRVDRWGDPVKRQILQYQWGYGESLNEPKRLGYWLVVGGADRITDEVCRRLEDYGAIIKHRVHLGYQTEDRWGHPVIRAAHFDEVRSLLVDCGELDGVVFLHGLSANPDSHDPTGETAIATLVSYSQGMVDRWTEERPRVYVVTQNAFAVQDGDECVNPVQTAINGFVRVAFNELEGLRFSTVDLPDHPNSETFETLVLELLCDDVHDEVAIRHGMRLTSELLESNVLTDDRLAYVPLDDDRPVLVRQLRDDFESVGTARILATELPALADDEVRLRIESIQVPTDLLSESAQSIEAPCVAVVARVMATGTQVKDLPKGQRVAGFVPSDLASHMTVKRHLAHLQPVDESLEAAGLLSILTPAVRATHATHGRQGGEQATALVWDSPLGRLVADRLQKQGFRVTYVVEPGDGEESQRHESVYSCCPEGIARAVRERTDQRGFHVLVANMSDWMSSFDLRMLRAGATVIDTDDQANGFVVAPHVQTVVRTAMSILIEQPISLSHAISQVIQETSEGKLEIAPCLEVTVADLAWQKLPLADTRSTLVLHFDTRGQDLPVVQRDELKFRSDATYLITGGLGGLGKKTAEWLIAHGARHIALTGRTGANTPERQAIVTHLERLGAHVAVVACDTADFDRLTRAWDEIERTMPPIRGVFHSGAVIMDQPITEIDADTFALVMRSKALGAWNLHKISCTKDLDHFVLYSSVANLVGNSRQSAYSAANGYLNGLAYFRQSLGFPATSVNWGAIADVGVVAQDEKLEQFLRYTGLRGIESSEALESLHTALARGVPQYGITMITSWADWARFETRGSTSPRFASLIAADSQGKDDSLRDALMAELEPLEHADRVELMAKLILEIVASAMKADPSTIPLDRAINQLGVDSLMATEIQLMLDGKLGLNVSILELIGDTTVRSLAVQSVRTLCGGAVGSAVGATSA